MSEPHTVNAGPDVTPGPLGADIVITATAYATHPDGSVSPSPPAAEHDQEEG